MVGLACLQAFGLALAWLWLDFTLAFGWIWLGLAVAGFGLILLRFWLDIVARFYLDFGLCIVVIALIAL